MQTIIDFIEAYYPNYSSCDKIANNDDLYKILEGSINGDAEDLYNEIQNELIEKNGIDPEEFEILEVVNLRLQLSNLDMYEKAIEGYIDNQKSISIESAKQFLRDNGYFVDNLWNVSDVQNKYNCTDQQAQNVLYSALQNEATKEQIQFAINMHAEFDNLPKKSKYFSISGFWKDTKKTFINYIVKEHYEANDESENIFFYGINEDEIKHEIEAGEATALDFVITSYEETTLN